MSTEVSNYSIPIEPLTRKAFELYGDLIDAKGAEPFGTNCGDALRFHRLGAVDCSAESGQTMLSIFRVLRTGLPTQIAMLERHPLSSQAFVPLAGQRFVIIVAQSGKRPSSENLRAFVSDGHQGVNYHRAIWHHPLIALDAGDFLVVDRDTEGPDFQQDYEEVTLMGDIFVDPREVETILFKNSHTMPRE